MLVHKEERMSFPGEASALKKLSLLSVLTTRLITQNFSNRIITQNITP